MQTQLFESTLLVLDKNTWYNIIVYIKKWLQRNVENISSYKCNQTFTNKSILGIN